jgi:hypothetical protein
MERAEDKGMSLFSYTANKCYINKNSLSDATSAGLGIELKRADPSSLPRDYRGGQQLLHFGKDGTLNVLNSKTSTNGQANIIYKFGLDTAVPQCDFKEGGVIMQIGGSWGLNCNDIEKTYTEEALLYDGYTSSDYAKLQDIIKSRQATNIRYELKPETPVAGRQYCNSVMGRDCGNNDGTFEEWIRRGGSCPIPRNDQRNPDSPWNICKTGCSYLHYPGTWNGEWRCRY